jgi:hypothetical protein
VKGGPTQRAYLERGLAKGISAINRWISAVELVDDPGTPWSEVDAYCETTNFHSAKSGADHIKAMRKHYDLRTV